MSIYLSYMLAASINQAAPSPFVYPIHHDHISKISRASKFKNKEATNRMKISAPLTVVAPPQHGVAEGHDGEARGDEDKVHQDQIAPVAPCVDHGGVCVGGWVFECVCCVCVLRVWVVRARVCVGVTRHRYVCIYVSI